MSLNDETAEVENGLQSLAWRRNRKKENVIYENR